MLYTKHYASPVGSILLAEEDGCLTGLWFVGQRCVPGPALQAARQRDTPLLRQTAAWLDRYFAKEKPDPQALPLAPAGSAFRQSVWALLREIPYGQTTTYGAIAKELAARRGGGRLSAQAVGGAVGHNPIGILLPCHRVVGANGSLTGYAGGLPIKSWLLLHEGVDMTGLFLPPGKTAL